MEITENDSTESNNDEEEESQKPVEVVFLENENLAHMVEVKTGISDDTYMEIIEGLEEGKMVISGTYKAISKELEDSVKVNITNQRGKKNKEN